MEELLEKARRDYPAGTVFKSAFNPDRKGKVTHLNFFVENENIFTDQLYDDLVEEGIGEAIYYEGVWAKIISKPEVKEEDMSEFLGLPKEGRSIVTDPYGGDLAKTPPTTRTFGQIKEDNFFKTATESLCKMLEAKNKAYGESALKPLDIFAKHHPYGARIDEKLSRVKNSSELRKNDVADIIGGLLLICKDKGWDDFTDLID